MQREKVTFEAFSLVTASKQDYLDAMDQKPDQLNTDIIEESKDFERKCSVKQVNQNPTHDDFLEAF